MFVRSRARRASALPRVRLESKSYWPSIRWPISDIFCTDFNGLTRWIPSGNVCPVTRPKSVSTPTCPVGIEVVLAINKMADLGHFLHRFQRIDQVDPFGQCLSGHAPEERQHSHVSGWNRSRTGHQ